MQCITGNFAKTSRWAPEISEHAIVRAAESRILIDFFFGERSTPMLAFERPRGLAVRLHSPQWAIVVSKDRVLAAFASFIYSCVQLRFWDISHELAAVLHQCYIMLSNCP